MMDIKKVRSLLPSVDIDLLMQLPINVYWVDKQLRHMGHNHHFLHVLGYTQAQEATLMGRTVLEIALNTTIPIGMAKTAMDNCQRVMEQQTNLIFEEKGFSDSNSYEQNTSVYLSTKLPLIENNQAIGCFGYSIPLQTEIGEKVQAGLLKLPCQQQQKAPTAALTAREQECLQLLAYGLSFKQIASRVNISTRTVRFHFENIKHKLGCINRFDIIDKAVELGLLQVKILDNR